MLSVSCAETKNIIKTKTKPVIKFQLESLYIVYLFDKCVQQEFLTQH